MEIANSVEEQFGFKLDRKKVQLDEPIKLQGIIMCQLDFILK